jgi:hypothetical protein
MDPSGISPLIVGVLVSIVGGVFAILGASVNARGQERAAKLRIEADLRLQADRLRDAAASADLAWRRTKLEELYVFLSDVTAQCSQTQATLDYQMGRDLEKHAARWAELRDKLGRARATAVTFPEISHHISEIEGKIDNFYWTSRILLQHDHDLSAENDSYGQWYKKVIQSSDETAAAVSKVGRALDEEVRRLAEMAPLFDVEKERFLRSGVTSGPRFKSNVKRDVIVLTEITPKGISITNAAEEVIPILVQYGVLDPIKPRRIVYPSHMGRWNGLAVRDGNFAGFVHLEARSEEDAIQAAIQSDWNAQSP